MIEIYSYIIENTYEFLGVVFSIIYVSFSIKQNILCWPALIVAALFNMYAYYLINLPLQTIMQIFFISTALYGWFNWNKKNNAEPLKVTSWKSKKHLISLSIGLFLTGFLTVTLQQLSTKGILHSDYPFSDSLILVFNIIPMYMTGKKILESWIYFIIIDIYSGLFFYRRIEFKPIGAITNTKTQLKIKFI